VPDEEEPPPNWQTLLLPAGLGAQMVPIPPASLEAHVDLGGTFPVDRAFSWMRKRRFWLTTVHDGRISLQGGWEALGRPRQVAVFSWHMNPGAALVNAAYGDVANYEVVKVGKSGNTARVSLPAAVFHRLQIVGNDEQILMTMSGMFLVLLNPHWSPELAEWDEIVAGRG